MANPYHDFTAEKPISGYQDLNSGLRNLGTSFAKALREKKAQEDAIKLFMLKAQMEKDQALAVEEAKQQAEFDYQGKQFERSRQWQQQYPDMFGGAQAQSTLSQPNFTKPAASPMRAPEQISRNVAPQRSFNINAFNPVSPVNPGEPPMFVSKIDPMTGKATQVENPAYKSFNQINLVKQKQDLIQRNNSQKAVYKIENDVNTAVNGLSVIEGDINKVLESYHKMPEWATGPFEGRTKGVFGYWTQGGGKDIKKGTINPNTKKPYTDEEIKLAKASPIVQYEDTKKFILGNISRTLAGEKGVLTDQDITRIERAFPTKADTPETAASKIVQIKDFIRLRVENFRNTAMQNISNIQNQGSTEPITEQQVDPEYQRYLELIGEAQ